MRKKIILVAPRGFCAGVARAVKAVEETLAVAGAPVYVKHEIVHNRHVVADLAAQGAVTVESLAEVPDGATVVFSAHGSPRAHYEEAARRRLRLIDATCPLVTKVHLELLRFLRAGYAVVYIGHRGHVEGIGVLGEAPDQAVPIVESVADVAALDIGQPEKLVYLTQTTLAVGDTADIIAALRRKYPRIEAPPIADICFATTNRQAAVKALCRNADAILIFGSQNSSNSNRLREVAAAEGREAYLLDDVSELDPSWLDGKQAIGISAGASAPERVIDEAVEWFRARGYALETFDVTKEDLSFAAPLELARLKEDQK